MKCCPNKSEVEGFFDQHHGAGWAINIKPFKYWESQRVRAKSQILGIKRTTDMQYEIFTQSEVRIVKQKIVWCVAAGVNNLLRFFFKKALSILIFVYILYYPVFVLYEIAMPTHQVMEVVTVR